MGIWQCLQSCKKASTLMSKSFEEPLSLGENVALHIHLAMCKTCVYCYRQISKLRDVFARYPEDICAIKPPSDKCLPPDSQSRIQSAVLKKIR